MSSCDVFLSCVCYVQATCLRPFVFLSVTCWYQVKTKLDHVVFAVRCYASTAYAIMRCLVTFVHFVKTNNISSKFFHHQVATPFYSFPIPNCIAIFGRDPLPPSLTRASNAGGVGRITILSQYLASVCAVNAATSQVLSVRRGQTTVHKL